MRWNDVCEKSVVKILEQGFLYAAFTDLILCLRWPLNDEDVFKLAQELLMSETEEYSKKTEQKIEDVSLSETRLLECRIFNENYEYRLARTDLGSGFQERFIDDGREEYKDYFDEMQYLDIDDNNSKKKGNYCSVTATGGGCYELPIENFRNAKIRIRNYVGYYKETGQAYITDWRLVGFGKEEEDGTV